MTTSTNQPEVNQPTNDSLEEAILYAKKYLEDLISFFGLNIDVYATTNDNEIIELNVPSTHLNGFLIGQKGDTMRSMQQIISSALKNQHYTYPRVIVDIADYKKQRASRIAEKAKSWIESAKASEGDYPLQPMSPADRRVVHQVVAEHGLTTESVGEGRDRHIVIKAGKKEV